MTADLDSLLASARVFAIPLVERFRGITVREGILLRGPAGWAEFAPFRDYPDAECVPWLRSAVESATMPWPQRFRDRIEVNTTVPVVPEERAAELVRASGCRTAKVKVADPTVSLSADARRVAAVRDALGPDGKIRVEGEWRMDRRPGTRSDRCARHGRRRAGIRRTALPHAGRTGRGQAVGPDPDRRGRFDLGRATDPAQVVLAGAADIAVIKVAPLGGVRAALRIPGAAGLPVGGRCPRWITRAG